MPHPSHEVTVDGSDTAFPLGQDAQMPAHTRPAGRRRYGASGVDEILDITEFDALLINLLRCRYDDRPDVFMNFFDVLYQYIISRRASFDII